jgi:hypothetical protein
MAVEHIIAKMTAHGVAITGAGFGGISELSQTDAAWALSGLHGPVYWFMRLKFCADASMVQPLRDSIAWQILGEAMTGATDLTARAAVGIAAAAIMQATTGPVCNTCHGTGTVITPTEASDCKPCRGTGRLAMTQDRAAGIVGVSVPTYAKKYEREVNRYVALLESYETRGLSHVRMKVRG